MSSDRASDIELERLADALARLNRRTRRRLALPLSASSMAALATVCDHGPLRLGDLAAAEGVTPATLSRIVALLEDESLVERSVDPDDRRSSFLGATAQGRAAVRRLRRDRAAVLEQDIAALAPEHRAALLAAVPAFEALAGD